MTEAVRRLNPPPFPPFPPQDCVLQFPLDHYLHVGAPTEWWWHIGTLTAGGRVFGFELNAAHMGEIYFTQVMLTDVQNGKHYEQTVVQSGTPTWAESDPTQDWYAGLGDPRGSAYIAMKAPRANPTDMTVHAALVDADTGTLVSFALRLTQAGAPFIVWGSGVMPFPPNPGGLQANNYYYSLTNLQASGSITLAGETFAVTGVTWMDHEYGFFGPPGSTVKWFLQDMQLDNGVSISNSASFTTEPPKYGVPTTSTATIQYPDGTIYYRADASMTPTGRTWTSPRGVVFFLEFQVLIPEIGSFTVVSSVDGQDFPFPGLPNDTYEGVATVTGVFLGESVGGKAWNEQSG